MDFKLILCLLSGCVDGYLNDEHSNLGLKGPFEDDKQIREKLKSKICKYYRVETTITI